MEDKVKCMDINNFDLVEYNEAECWSNEYALCPYCGYHNRIDGDSYGDQDEALEDTCARCERTFVRYTDYAITFSTEPIENYLVKDIRIMQRRVRRTKEQVAEECSAVDKFYYSQQLEYFEAQLHSLLEKLAEMRIANEN